MSAYAFGDRVRIVNRRGDTVLRGVVRYANGFCIEIEATDPDWSRAIGRRTLLCEPRDVRADETPAVTARS